MDFDTFIGITALVCAVSAYAIMRFSDKTRYAKYNKTGNAEPKSRKKRGECK